MSAPSQSPTPAGGHWAHGRSHKSCVPGTPHERSASLSHLHDLAAPVHVMPRLFRDEMEIHGTGRSRPCQVVSHRSLRDEVAEEHRAALRPSDPYRGKSRGP